MNRNSSSALDDTAARRWRTARGAGREGPLQPLHAALGDHDGPHAYAQHRQAQRAQEQADQDAADQRREQRELLATACPGCHRTADKYKNPRYASDGEHLCHFCQQKETKAV